VIADLRFRDDRRAKREVGPGAVGATANEAMPSLPCPATPPCQKALLAVCGIEGDADEEHHNGEKENAG